LDFLFESLKNSENENQASVDLGANSVYRYKPDKFNEIINLNESELNHELLNKESLLRLTNSKVKN